MALFQKSVLNQYLKQLDKNEVAKAYTLFKNHFHNPTIQQHIRDSKEEQYQGEFLIDLFVDVLGYTKNPQPNFNLQTEQKNETDSKKADGAILKAGNVIAVIELKGTNTTDLSTVTGQAFGYKNNQKNCKYIIISNFEKLRFYIDNAIDFEEFDLFTLTAERFDLLYLCLQYSNLLSDLPETIKKASTVKEINVTKQLYKDYSDFKRKLFTDIVQLNPQYDKLILFKKSQKLIDRILFILFAEDRGLLQANTVQTILDEFENLQKLDAYSPLYSRFKKHFTYLNEGFKNDKYEVFGYNGGLFAPDEILDTISISDNILQNYTPVLAKYDYDTEIDVNILGHIFEHSLNDIEEIQAEIEGKEIDKTKTKRKKDGVFYTPKYITKYIVENTVGALCTEKRNEFEVIADNYTPDKRKAKKIELLQKLDIYQNWLLQITIVDPACGSGAFLNQALEFLIQEHKSIDELRAQLLGHGFVLPDHETAILENNIFGVDLNEESVEIARLSLWLRTARKGRKLNSLNNNIKCGNSLIDDKTIAGEKAFSWQTEFKEIFERGGFDVVIGNPPYITFALGAKQIHDEESTNFLKENYPISAGYKVSSYLIFIEKGIELLNNYGFISYIVPNTYHTNFYFKDFRNYLINSTKIVSILNLRYKVFEDAEMGFTSIPVIKKTIFDNQVKLMDILNKDLFENISPTLINQSAFSKIPDYKFLFSDNINIWFKSFNNSLPLSDKTFEFYNGIKTGNNEKFISEIQIDERYKPLITGKDFTKYFTSDNIPFVLFNKKELWSNTNEEKFLVDEKLIIRRTSDHLFVSYDNKKRFCLDTIHTLSVNNKKFSTKYILSLLNSRFLNFLYRIIVPEIGKAFAEVKIINLKKLPIKQISIFDQEPFIEKADIMLTKNIELQNIKGNFIKLIQSRYSGITINTKLGNWNELTFKDLCKELEKQKIKLSISEQAELMEYFTEQQTKANSIQQTISQTDKEIDNMVYKLYDLSVEEIKIIEQEK